MWQWHRYNESCCHSIVSIVWQSLMWLSNNRISYLNVMQFSSKSNQLWNKQDMQTFKLLQDVSTPPFQPATALFGSCPREGCFKLVDCSTYRWLHYTNQVFGMRLPSGMTGHLKIFLIPVHVLNWACSIIHNGWISNHTSKWNEGHNRFFAHWSLPRCFNRTSLATFNRGTLTVSHCKCERWCQTWYCC